MGNSGAEREVRGSSDGDVGSGGFGDETHSPESPALVMKQSVARSEPRYWILRLAVCTSKATGDAGNNLLSHVMKRERETPFTILIL